MILAIKVLEHVEELRVALQLHAQAKVLWDAECARCYARAVPVPAIDAWERAKDRLDVARAHLERLLAAHPVALAEVP